MAVTRAPVRQQSYLTEYDKQMAQYLREMGGSIGANDFTREAMGNGGQFPVGTMTAKILSGVLAGASDKRAANRIKQSNAAQVALLRDSQEYSEPLPTEFEGAGKFTDAQGTYTQELAPVYQGIPQDVDKAAFDARMLKEQYPEGVLASGVQPPGKVDVAMVEGPKSEFETTGAAYSQPEITEEFATQQNITPYAEPERKQLYPQETVQGITVKGSKKDPDWWDRNIRGDIPEVTASNVTELAQLAGYDPLEYNIYQQNVKNNTKSKETFEASFPATIFNDEGLNIEGRISEKIILDTNGNKKKIATIYNPNKNEYVPLPPGHQYIKMTTKQDSENKPRHFIYNGKETVSYTDTDGVVKNLSPGDTFRTEGSNTPQVLLDISQTQDATEKKLTGDRGFTPKILIHASDPGVIIGRLLSSTDGLGGFTESISIGNDIDIPINENGTEKIVSFKAGDMVNRDNKNWNILYNSLVESTTGSVSEFSKGGYLNANKLNELRKELVTRGISINALANYTNTIDDSDVGIKRTIDKIETWYKTVFYPNLNLDDPNVAQAVSSGLLSSIGGQSRLDILGPGVMTEFDFLRLKEALGGDPDSKQSIQAFKRTLKRIMDEKQAIYRSELDHYEKQRTSFGAKRGEVFSPIKWDFVEYKSFFEPSQHPTWTSGSIKQMTKNDDLYKEFFRVANHIGVNAKKEDFIGYFNSRQLNAIEQRLKQLGVW